MLLRPTPVARTDQFRAALLRVLSLSMVLALTFQSIPLPINAQVSPLTSLLGLMALPLLIVAQRRIVITPLAKMVLAFVGFLVVHSTVAVFLDVVVWRAEGARLLAWIRQLLSLAAGGSVFWVLRSTLRAISDRQLARLLMLGAILPVIIGALNIAWGLGVAPAGTIVVRVRQFLAPQGFTYPFRASGLSLEPSHFIWYLSVVVFPTGLVLLSRVSGWRRMGLIALLTAAAAGFLWTFSGSGYMVAAIMALGLAPRLRPAWVGGGVLAVLVGIGFVVFVFPDNYLILSLGEIWRAVQAADLSLLNYSATTALFSILGPFLTADSSLTSIGYGLGATSTHLDAMVPPVAEAAIRAVTWEGMPSLGIMIGKLFGEAGLLGLLLFLGIWPMAWHQIRAIRRRSVGPALQEVDLTVAARFAMVGLLAGYCIKQGSFAIPFLWFWLAYIDARFIASQANPAATV